MVHPRFREQKTGRVVKGRTQRGNACGLKEGGANAAFEVADCRNQPRQLVFDGVGTDSSASLSGAQAGGGKGVERG